MTQINQQKGFTLVELAIVLTIIGLLIGGILKGQQLIENARISATISQVKAIEAAMTTFRDTYSALPGDMVNAPARVPDCGLCGLLPAGNPVGTAGNGIIGPTAWNMLATQSAPYVGTAAAGIEINEPVLYWAELANSGLLSGITDEGTSGAVPATFGGTLPSARVGGGWVVGNANTAGTPAGRSTVPNNMVGPSLALVPSPTAAMATTASAQVLTPSIAAQVDRKMDDGAPATGFVQAYGVQLSCFTAAAGNLYNEIVVSKDCGQFFRMGG